MNTQYFDNTRISSFMACPRHYFFRHVKHWRPDGVPIYFAFGSAWHACMDIIWSQATLPRDELIELAFKAFVVTFEDETPENYEPREKEIRNAGLARDMIISYVDFRQEQLKRYEILSIEAPFMVPLDEAASIHYIGRLDKVFKEDGRIYVGEHKTTTSYAVKGNFQARFIESFAPNNQVDGYIYAGIMQYGDDFRGVNIDAALVHKSVRAFKTIPISKLSQITESWLYEMNYWAAEIKDNTVIYEEMLKIGDEESFMPCFPKCTGVCSAFQGYSKCSYRELCRYSTTNPTFMETPQFFVYEPWEPYELLFGKDEGEFVETLPSNVIPIT